MKDLGDGTLLMCEIALHQYTDFLCEHPELATPAVRALMADAWLDVARARVHLGLELTRQPTLGTLAVSEVAMRQWLAAAGQTDQVSPEIREFMTIALAELAAAKQDWLDDLQGQLQALPTETPTADLFHFSMKWPPMDQTVFFPAAFPPKGHV